MNYTTASDALQALVEAYYLRRNPDDVLACVTEDIEWIGTEERETAHGKPALRPLLEADIAAWPEPFAIEMGELREQTLGPDAAMLTVDGHQTGLPGTPNGFFVRATVCAVRTEAGWLINNAHTSTPNLTIEKHTLERELKLRRTREQTLMAGIPGGIAVYRLKKDGRIETEYVSESLAKMCGYTVDDFLAYLREDARINILPEDVGSVMRDVSRALTTGKPISVRYHIYNKQREPLFIRLDANMLTEEPEREDDVAVFYAVHTVISEEVLHLLEKQEQMEELVNRVPAGLGIYDLEDGTLWQRYMNDAYYRMLGRPRAERVGYTGDNTISAAHPDDLPTIYAVVQKMQDGEDRVECSYRVRLGDDAWFWVHMCAQVVLREENHLRIYANFIDYNAVKLAEQTEEENRVTLSVAMQAAKVLAWRYDCRTATITDTLTLGERYGLPKTVGGVPQSLMDMGFIAPESVRDFTTFFDRVSPDGPATVDVKIPAGVQGEAIWYKIVDTPVHDADGRFTGSIGTCIDITEQKERELHYEEQLKLTGAALKDAATTASINLTKNTVTAQMNDNPVFDGLLRFDTADALFADGARYAFDAEEAAKFEPVRSCAALREAYRQGTTHYEIVAHIKRKSAWVKVTYNMLENPYTHDLELILALYDVTASMRSERVISRLLAVDYKSILLISTADGSAITYRNAMKNDSLDMLYDYQKKAGTGFAGVEAFLREHALPGTAAEVIRNNSIPYIRKQLETAPTYETLYTLVFDGRPERLRVLYSYLDGDEGTLLSATQDVTEMYDRELQQKTDLANALAAAENANRAKTDFLSRVSHDMRTPLNGILGLTTLLKERVTDPGEQQDLQQLQLSGNYLLNLINDTLDMSKIESGKLQLVPVVCDGRAALENVVLLAKPSVLAKKIKFDVQAENLPFTTLFIDISRVEQILMNIIGNAIKFTPEGGTIRLIVENLGAKDGVLTDRFTVEDNGIGMSEEFLPHLFDPFSQEDSGRTSRTQGTGLGMSITKRIIEEMGGEISVESTPGQGTTFRFTLPMPCATPEQIAEWKASAGAQSGQSQSLAGRRVLLCEDHPLNAQIAERLLRKKGMLVDHAEDGAAGVKLFEQSPLWYYDAVLMDIRMPVMDGMAASRAIRALPRADATETPIIAMTANAFDEDIRQALEAGMNAHLGKPIETGKLFATLARLMRPAHTHRQTVLVVDDEEVNRAVIVAALAADYNVLEAANGKEALDVLAHNPSVDAVITDLQMPVMDGRELVRALRAQEATRHLPIITNTQFGDPAQQEALLALGATDFVYKPNTPKLVTIRVKNALK